MPLVFGTSARAIEGLTSRLRSTWCSGQHHALYAPAAGIALAAAFNNITLNPPLELVRVLAPEPGHGMVFRKTLFIERHESHEPLPVELVLQAAQELNGHIFLALQCVLCCELLKCSRTSHAEMAPSFVVFRKKSINEMRPRAQSTAR